MRIYDYYFCYSSAFLVVYCTRICEMKEHFSRLSHTYSFVCVLSSCLDWNSVECADLMCNKCIMLRPNHAICLMNALDKANINKRNGGGEMRQQMAFNIFADSLFGHSSEIVYWNR